MWKIKLHPKAKKELLDLDPKARKQISEVIRKLEHFPNTPLDIKVLKGLSYHKYKFLRVRIGRYRVVFVPIWSERILLIIAVGSRGSVYKDLRKRV